MSVKIKLTEGEELTLSVDGEEWENAFQKALADDKVLRIEDTARGRVLTINPRSVAYSYLEGTAEDALPARDVEAAAR